MFEPLNLRVDYDAEPLGLDNPRPAFSWEIRADGRCRRQSAFRIRVASEEDALHAGRADVWDSGKVASDRTTGVDYAGPALGSAASCWWTVHVWDETDAESTAAQPARFVTGLLAPADWQAQWIGACPAIFAAASVPGSTSSVNST